MFHTEFVVTFVFDLYTRNKYNTPGSNDLLVIDIIDKRKFPLCLTKHHATKTYRGSGGIAPHILNLDTRWRWVVSFTTRPLNLGERRRYALDKRLGGPQSRSGRGGEGKKCLLCPCRESNLGPDPTMLAGLLKINIDLTRQLCKTRILKGVAYLWQSMTTQTFRTLY
jgi:hypothetical protein